MADDISKKILIQVEADTNQVAQSIADLNQTLDALLQKQKQLTDSGQQNTKVYQDMATQVKATQAAIDNHSKAIDNHSKAVDNNVKALGTSNSALQQNKDKMVSLLQQYDSLSKSQGDHSAGVKALNAQIGTLSNTIAGQVTDLNKSREVFDVHKGTINALSSSFDKLKGVSGTFGPSLQGAAKGFDALKSGLSVVKTGFSSVGEAIKTTGFGLLVLVLQSVVEYFTKTTEGSKKLKGAISAIGFVVDSIHKAFAALGKIIVDAVSHPVKSIEALADMIKENIINRFKAFSVILDGIVHLDFKKMADGAIQAFTGVTHATDKITSAFKSVKNGIAEVSTQVANAYTEGFKEADKVVDDHQKKLNKLLATKKKISEKSQEQAASTPAETKPTDSKKADAAGEKDKAAVDELQSQLIEKAKELNDRILQADEKLVKDTVDPSGKLAAEKQLITDKYQFEIEQAQGNSEKIKAIEDSRNKEIKALDDKAILEKNTKAEKAAEDIKNFELQEAKKVSDAAISIIKNSIAAASEAKISGLEKDKAAELSNSSLTSAQKLAIEQKFKQQEGKIKTKAFKQEQEASILQAVINGALAVTKGTSQTGVLAALFVPAIIAETAIQVATIAAQKPPAYAKGGLHYTSDGHGGVLTGYSKTDNTNAFLRSGEGIVVSEAMQVPWARNLVSAINVGFGGRDFSTTNPGRGFAVGGVFTDGGDANRYYNQPVTDQKNLANTIAYQMINNFPPVYVDVKDVNNQQNILAQTVNRVNL
ncbi:MAG TPA: hypothetical protein DCO83_00110 [Mucilaginibacter sp.]|jgi:myosin heavy subunit|nr:hypothetical protein [Mucilaginibacter sp.]